MILDETFNKEKIYLSPAKDKVAIFFNDQWQVFYSEKAILEINNFAAENFRKKHFVSSTEAIFKLNTALSLEEVNNTEKSFGTGLGVNE